MDAFEAFVARAIRFRSLPLLPSRPAAPPPATEPPPPTQEASVSVSQPKSEYDEDDLPDEQYEQMMQALERRGSGGSAGTTNPQRLVLLDDLPYAHDKPQRARLAALVQVLPTHPPEWTCARARSDVFAYPCV